jgi:hypothetical protein
LAFGLVGERYRLRQIYKKEKIEKLQQINSLKKISYVYFSTGLENITWNT